MQNVGVTSGRTEQCCAEHRRSLELFCQEDETFICVLCVPRHSSHNFVFLHEAANVYKDKLKTALTSLEVKVKEHKYLQNKQEKEVTDIQEDALSLEQYIKQEFAKLHQFLQDEEQKLIQQLKNLKSEEADILNEILENLECIKYGIIASHVAVSGVNLELKNEEAETLKEMEIKSEFTENDVMATPETSNKNLALRQHGPVELITIPETFEDVVVTFSEEEWKILKKQDKELYREVMVDNYEAMVSLGYSIPPMELLLLLKEDDELPEGGAEGENTTEQKDNLVGKVPGNRSTECSVTCSQQQSLGASQLHHPAKNLQPCAQPVRGCNKPRVTSVPPLHLGRSYNKRSESDASKKPYKCSECRKCFTRLSNLRHHHAIHTGDKPYKCTECSKGFACLGNLRKHYVIHTGDKPYKCTECSKCFTRRSHLEYHQNCHTGTKPFECPECTKCFADPRSLQKHYAIHTGEKPYKCTECGKCFTQKTHLKYHQNSHTGMKPYKCTECSKCFTHQSSVRKHRVIHTGEKPYKCTECSKCFTHPSGLRKHRVFHTGEKPYQCTECGKCFTQHSGLQKHRVLHSVDLEKRHSDSSSSSRSNKANKKEFSGVVKYASNICNSI